MKILGEYLDNFLLNFVLMDHTINKNIFSFLFCDFR